jgi:hypothetical protein
MHDDRLCLYGERRGNPVGDLVLVTDRDPFRAAGMAPGALASRVVTLRPISIAE